MLKLKHIIKDYVLKDSEPVHALKDVSINFRKNEFVAILGASGCGKTTLLNITGGLDRYTKGDLIIEGRSTKGFSDRDWDTYRNHSVGFVFQSYNLVSHLSVLGNVELALSIGGYKKNEKRKKAIKAIDEVGLKGLYNKKPNQLSGGQMQRVAIARALVTDPEIVLADEPTGALDSETSIQIMDLLKEVAHDRLVIMVTHNPDLAETYASRIIRLHDGEVMSDTMPLSDEEELLDHSKKENEKPTSKAKMSFATSFVLSSKNLLAKFKRTALVCVAGSIGIIGVSAVLAMSTGVSSYIDSMQDDMLSGNPIGIEKSTLDVGSLMTSFSKTSQAHSVVKAWDGKSVNVDFMIKYLAEQRNNLESYIVNNDISKEYIDFVDSMPSQYYAAMKKDYGINFKYNIFTEINMTDADDPISAEKRTKSRYLSLEQLESMYVQIVEKTSFSDYSSVISLLTNVLYSQPNDRDYILSQYDLIAGDYYSDNTYPDVNEIMLVVSGNHQLTDVFLGQLGYYSQDDFVDIVNCYADNENIHVEPEDIKDKFDYEELLGKEFVYVPYSSNYTFQENTFNNPEMFFKMSTDSVTGEYTGTPLDVPYRYNGEATSLDDLVNNHGGKRIKISGILCAKKNVSYGCLDTGFIVSPEFEQMMIEDSLASNIPQTIQKSYDETYSVLPADLDQELYEDAWKSKYTMVVPYSYSYHYRDMDGVTHFVPEPSLMDISKLSFAMQVMNISGGFGGGGLSDIFSRLMGGSYSIENQFETAIRSIAGNDLAAGVLIYPYSFEKKDLVTNYLDQWNKKGDLTYVNKDGVTITLTESQRSEINYSDNLELIITLIDTMITVVTVALVCFTSLSLVVSTVMIGIITYVSVLERVKEIGVIRSLGGRKMDVSNLFNAETFIEGAISGGFGILVTYVLCIILNIIINLFAPLGSLVYLPWNYALIILGVSILLTLISGLIPSRAAAHKDPVIALRSE